jgi:tRNA G46 methylase TrmB
VPPHLGFADIGCGHGASTILMAQAFPKSSFVGPDYHDASIATRGMHPRKDKDMETVMGRREARSGFNHARGGSSLG